MGALTGAGAAPSLIWQHPCDVTSQPDCAACIRHYPRPHPRGGPSSLRQLPTLDQGVQFSAPACLLRPSQSVCPLQIGSMS